VSSPLPPYPQVIIEAGFASPAPVAPPGTMTLDDAANGLLDTDTLDTAISWTDISRFALNMTITRASTRQQGPLLQYQAGTLSVLLDNSLGYFDPDNLAGGYVSGGVSLITPMVPIRVRAMWAGITWPLFSGFADSWAEIATDYEAGYSEWTLSATDGFKVLAGITLAPLTVPAGSGELSGARVQRILNSAMWFTGTQARIVGAGNSPVQATSYGDTALNLLQVTADSEIGQLYVDGTGAVVFRQRQALITDTRSSIVQAAFGDLPVSGSPPWTFANLGNPVLFSYFIIAAFQAPAVSIGDIFTTPPTGGTLFTVTAVSAPFAGYVNVSFSPSLGAPMAVGTLCYHAGAEYPYAGVGRVDDDTTIANDIQATRVGGTLQEITNAASIARYLFPRTYTRQDLVLNSDPDTLSWAAWILYVAAGGENRFDPLTIDPLANPGDLYPQVLGRQMGDRIQVTKRPPETGWTVTKQAFISGITHTADFTQNTWQTVFTLQDASKYGSFMTLDNTTTGLLDYNALVY
jgi:hypothetical protein